MKKIIFIFTAILSINFVSTANAQRPPGDGRPDRPGHWENDGEGGSCNGRRIFRLAERGEQAVHNDNKLEALKAFNMIQEEVKNCKLDHGVPTPTAGPRCTYSNPKDTTSLFNTSLVYYSGGSDVNTLRKIYNGSQFEFLGYASLNYNGDFLEVVKVRLLYSEAHARPPIQYDGKAGEILYFFKDLFEERCR
jgi:hypothetical protein